MWWPLFWELSSHSAREQLDAEAAFLRVLTIARVEEAFTRAFQETFRSLKPVQDGVGTINLRLGVASTAR